MTVKKKKNFGSYMSSWVFCVFALTSSLLPHFVSAENYRLFPTVNADDPNALNGFIKASFSYAQTAVLLLATVVITAAGVIYMSSAGNTKQIELAKKLIIGALSGVAVVILGKFFLQYVVGVPW